MSCRQRSTSMVPCSCTSTSSTSSSSFCPLWGRATKGHRHGHLRRGECFWTCLCLSPVMKLFFLLFQMGKTLRGRCCDQSVAATSPLLRPVCCCDQSVAVTSLLLRPVCCCGQSVSVARLLLFFGFFFPLLQMAQTTTRRHYYSLLRCIRCMNQSLCSPSVFFFVCFFPPPPHPQWQNLPQAIAVTIFSSLAIFTEVC